MAEHLLPCVLDMHTTRFPTVVAVDGNFTTSGGTSASAPIFASLIAAVNDARLAKGKGPVGWINPAVRLRISYCCARVDLTDVQLPPSFLPYARPVLLVLCICICLCLCLSVSVSSARAHPPLCPRPPTHTSATTPALLCCCAPPLDPWPGLLSTRTFHIHTRTASSGPQIYSHIFRSAFHDVTTGSNPGCATDGFPATRGWDPVTGLGTPNFPLLLSRFMGLP